MNGETFDVGEVAIIAGSNDPQVPVGTECTVLTILLPCPHPHSSHVDCKVHEIAVPGVTSRFCRLFVSPKWLRKRKPPASTWSLIERLTRWNPTKEPVT